MASYWLKNGHFLYPLSFSALDRGKLIRISEKSFTNPKTRVSVAIHGEDFVILECVVLTQYWSNRRTDRRTDASTMAKTREALHAVARKNAKIVQYLAKIWSKVGSFRPTLYTNPPMTSDRRSAVHNVFLLRFLSTSVWYFVLPYFIGG